MDQNTTTPKRKFIETNPLKSAYRTRLSSFDYQYLKLFTLTVAADPYTYYNNICMNDCSA